MKTINTVVHLALAGRPEEGSPVTLPAFYKKGTLWKY